MLFPYACGCGAKGAPLVPEGSPLLPSLSKANMHGYLIDIMVRLAVCEGSSRHRSQSVRADDEDVRRVREDEMAALLLSAGWKAVEVRRTPGALWAYTTAVPV